MNFPQKFAVLGIAVGFIRSLQGYAGRSFGLIIILVLVYFREAYNFYPVKSLLLD